MSSFQAKEENGYLLIICPMTINRMAAQEIFDLFQGWLMKPVDIYILDLKKTRSLDKQFFQTLIQIKSILKSNDKNLYSLNVAPAVLDEIRSSGMENTFLPVASVADALRSKNKSGQNLNMDFIQPFLVATKKVMEVQFKTKIHPKPPKIRDANYTAASIIGSIKLESKDSRGRFSIVLSMDVFRAIYFNMFSEKVDELNPEVADAVGEIVNIIYGQAKIELNKRGFKFDRAFPTVHFGTTLRDFGFSVGRSIVLPFDTDSGLIEVDIEFESSAIKKVS